MVNTGFNTQPPEGGWLEAARMRIAELVSTHSRPKAAGSHVLLTRPATTLFQHTAARRRLGYSAVCAWPAFMFQHTAARRRLGRPCVPGKSVTCFNTQPPEGGWPAKRHKNDKIGGFNTQPPEGGWLHQLAELGDDFLFQHTAARRRLEAMTINTLAILLVSTHSRPKAAGFYQFFFVKFFIRFQHTAARRRLEFDRHAIFPIF